MGGAQQRHVAIKLNLHLLSGREVLLELLAVIFHLRRQFSAGLSQLMQAMEMFDCLLQANRDKQADRNDGNVCEEVLPVAYGRGLVGSAATAASEKPFRNRHQLELARIRPDTGASTGQLHARFDDQLTSPTIEV